MSAQVLSRGGSWVPGEVKAEVGHETGEAEAPGAMERERQRLGEAAVPSAVLSVARRRRETAASGPGGCRPRPPRRQGPPPVCLPAGLN